MLMGPIFKIIWATHIRLSEFSKEIEQISVGWCAVVVKLRSVGGKYDQITYIKFSSR